jgi:hypothetical protein
MQLASFEMDMDERVIAKSGKVEANNGSRI